MGKSRAVQALLSAFVVGFAMQAAAKPSVNKVWAWQVTDKTAGLSMEVTNLPVPASVVFVYSTKADFSAPVEAGKSNVGPAATGSQSHAQLTGLQPKTTYYVKATATNKDGTTSATTQFTTAGGGTPPVIAKTWTSTIGPTTGLLSMQVDNKNIPSTAFFQYGTDAKLAGAAEAGRGSMQASTGIQTHASLSGLKPDTTYYYRAVVTNSNGTTEAPIQSFKTGAAVAPSPPRVAKAWSWEVTDKSAGVSMEVHNVPIATQVNFTYSTSQDFANPQVAGQSNVGPAATGSQSHATLKNLQPKTTYYVKAVATNKDGSTSATTSFRTAGDGPAPVMQKVWSSTVAQTTALVSMQVDNKNLISNAHFMFGTDAKLAGATKVGDSSMKGVTTGIQSHASLTGLKPGTTAYDKAVVNNVNGTSESPISSFTTAK